MAVISCTDSNETLSERTVDTLADIFHFASSIGLDPQALVDSAMRHYRAERKSWAKDPGAV